MHRGLKVNAGTKIILSNKLATCYSYYFSDKATCYSLKYLCYDRLYTEIVCTRVSLMTNPPLLSLIWILFPEPTIIMLCSRNESSPFCGVPRSYKLLN